MSLVYIIFMKSHKNTKECPEWDKPQSRGLTDLLSGVWIMRLLMKKTITYLGNHLYLFSFTCGYIVTIVSVSSAARQPQISHLHVTPCWPPRSAEEGAHTIVRAHQERDKTLRGVIKRRRPLVNPWVIGPGQLEALYPFLCPWHVTSAYSSHHGSHFQRYSS